MPFWTPVPGDPAPEIVRYDIWSNIHYGYVGRAHNIPENILRDGAALADLGAPARGDRIAIDIGFDLWRTWGRNLTPWILQVTVASRMTRFREWAGNVVRWPLRSIHIGQ